MKRSLTFHVPPDAGPGGLQSLLGAFQDAPGGFDTRAGLLEQMSVRMDGDAQPRGEAISLAHDLGIVTEEKGRIAATDDGIALGRIPAANDVVHGMQYLAWSSIEPQWVSRFWTYRAIVDGLWNDAPIVLDGAYKRRLVEHALVESTQTFVDVPGFDPSHTSVGPKTVDGVTCWLRQLAPPAIHEGRVQRRQACPPQLVVLALAAVGRVCGASPGTDFRLKPEHRDFVCRCCFLRPESLDRMLDWTVATQPRLLRWGTLISTYGRQVVLAKLDIRPEDFC